MSWLERIDDRLSRRDRWERDEFVEIVENNSRLQAQADTLLDRNSELEDTVARLKQQLHEFQFKQSNTTTTSSATSVSLTMLSPSIYQSTPVTPAPSIISETGDNSIHAATIAVLKNELSGLYKSQADTARKLLSATEELDGKREEVTRKEEAILMLTNQLKHANQRNQDLKTLVQEKNSAIQLLQDELTALQLELGKMEERCRQLEEDNRVLVERWLRKMNEEADQMNQANQFYASMMERRQRSLSPAASEMERTLLMMPRGGGDVYNLDDSQMAQALREDLRLRAGLKPSVVPSTCRLTLSLPPSASEPLVNNAICFSPDGELLAAGGSDRNLRIFNTLDEKYAPLGGCLQAIMCAKIDRQMECILATSNDNSVRVWSLQTARLRYTLTGHIGNVWAAEFNDGAKQIISGSHDRTIKIWDLQRGNCIRTLFAYSSIYDLSLTNDAGVISGHSDNYIRYWDTKTGDCIKEISGVHAGSITSISISPDAFQILTCSRDNTLKIIDVRTFRVLQTFTDEALKVPFNYSRACYSSDGRLVVVGGLDGKVFVWNSATGRLEKTFQYAGENVAAVAWSPQGQGQLAVAGSRRSQQWDGGLIAD